MDSVATQRVSNPEIESLHSLLPHSSPEAQGVSSIGVWRFIEAVDQQVRFMHSFMILRHGHILAQGYWPPHAPDKPHVLWSLSKSFTSTAVGLCVSQGMLSLDDSVIGFFPEYVPTHPGSNLHAMCVRDLLTMTTGHDSEPSLTQSMPWEQSFLAHPLPHTPGTHFLYNSAASHMLSAIIQKLTGETMLDFLRPRLFEPLGIT
ncbi:MAG: class A beta-lactamase-related serine hydrolase, partial [Cytophagaceae bacterium]